MLNRWRLAVLLIAVLAAVSSTIAERLSTVHAASPEGHLVLIGGGPTPSLIFTRTLQLAGGRQAIVAVLPQTHPNDSIGDAAVALWKQFGVRDVVKVSRTDPVAAQAAIERATLIWMPGGFQGFLMRTITGTGIPEAISARFAAGATIGGASAGAAAMSATMIADESAPDGSDVDNPATEPGLGLWPEAIVSPHFSERRRMNPLMEIVRQHRELVGVGIDEGTAIIVSHGELEVLGLGKVAIVDGRRLSGQSALPRAPTVRTLTPGTRFRLTVPQP